MIIHNLTTREKIKEVTDSLNHKQIQVLWKFIQKRFYISDVYVRELTTWEEICESERRIASQRRINEGTGTEDNDNV